MDVVTPWMLTPWMFYRPSSISRGGVTTSFTYDGNGTRVQKLGPNGWINYVGNLYEDAGGATTKYIYALGKRIAVKASNAAAPYDVNYYHLDHLGSTGIVTLSDGTVFQEIFYKPFGDEPGGMPVSGVTHRYTGQELDFETGLYFYHARYYNPVLGMFVSADSIVPDPSNPQAFNRYSYVINNPLFYTDPSGHSWLSKQIDKFNKWIEKYIPNELNIDAGAGVESNGKGMSYYGFNPRTGKTYQSNDQSNYSRTGPRGGLISSL